MSVLLCCDQIYSLPPSNITEHHHPTAQCNDIIISLEL